MTDCDVKEAVVVKYYSAIRSQIKAWNYDIEHILVYKVVVCIYLRVYIHTVIKHNNYI